MNNTFRYGRSFIHLHSHWIHRKNSYRKNAGFTLIEVMVAVGVIGIAIPALLFAMIGHIDASAHLRDKLQALWVAENVMAEIRIQNRIDGLVPKVPTSGEEKLGGRNWRWETRSQAFSFEELSDVYGVEVSVWTEEAEKDSDALLRYIGIVRNFPLEVIQRPEPEKNILANTPGGDSDSNSGNEQGAGSDSNSGSNANSGNDSEEEGISPDDPIWDEPEAVE